MKKVAILFLSLALLVGCSFNDKTSNDVIEIVKINNLNELADDFSKQKYDHFSQIKVDYEKYEVVNIEINHYKNGKIVDNLLRFKREKGDVEVPNIQYVYIGYNLYPKQNQDSKEQSITANVYLYGPPIKESGLKEYSMSFETSSKSINNNNLKFLEKVSFDERYYINPILINNEADINENTSIKDMIDSGIEMIVLEIK